MSAAVSPLYFAERLTEASRRREDLLQARRAEPHRRAQDQQLHRPDPAGPAHGQEAHHRRDRRGPARRRDRHGLRALRPQMHVFMGATDVERQKPNVFRMKLLGAEVRAGHLRHAHAEGRDERGAARLGDQCRRHLLLIGTAAGPHPYPDDGARLPVVIGNEAREQILKRRRAACPMRWSPASAAAPTRSACSIPSSTIRA
jgi:hypothetical protein